MAATNADFLVLPELLARSVSVDTNAPVYFALATPGAMNASGEAGLALPPSFSLPGGVYTSNLTVALTSPLSNAVIRFTLNGTKPGSGSALYTAPITLTSSALVRARVYAPGFLPSEPASAAYTLLETNMLGFDSGLPLGLLDTFSAVTIDMEPKAPAKITIIDVRPPMAIYSGLNMFTRFANPTPI